MNTELYFELAKTNASIWTKFKEIVEKNKEQRKYLGKWNPHEPDEIIYDEYLGNIIDEHGNRVFDGYDCNLLSTQWVQDLFGMDFSTIDTLMLARGCELVEVNGNFYYREQDIIHIISVLQVLAKTNFVNNLRPLPQNIKGVVNPVYTNKDLMTMLDLKDNTLRYYREEGYLGYTKCKGKILYTQEDVDNFLHHPEFRHEPRINSDSPL